MNQFGTARLGKNWKTGVVLRGGNLLATATAERGLQNALLGGDPDDHEFEVARTRVLERVRFVQQDRHRVTLMDLDRVPIHLCLAVAVQDEVDFFDSGVPVRSFGRAGG